MQIRFKIRYLGKIPLRGKGSGGRGGGFGFLADPKLRQQDYLG